MGLVTYASLGLVVLLVIYLAASYSLPNRGLTAGLVTLPMALRGRSGTTFSRLGIL